jgi:hypothetical protein
MNAFFFRALTSCGYVEEGYIIVAESEKEARSMLEKIDFRNGYDFELKDFELIEVKPLSGGILYSWSH